MGRVTPVASPSDAAEGRVEGPAPRPAGLDPREDDERPCEPSETPSPTDPGSTVYRRRRSGIRCGITS